MPTGTNGYYATLDGTKIDVKPVGELTMPKARYYDDCVYRPNDYECYTVTVPLKIDADDLTSLWDIRPKIKNVIFNPPATIVFWSDGTKTVVKCQQGDEWDAEKGLAMAISKKWFYNKGNFNNEFVKWLEPEEEEEEAIDLAEYLRNLVGYITLTNKPHIEGDGGLSDDY